MAADRIKFGLLAGVNSMSFADPENPTASIGMSDLKEFLKMAFGEDAPYDRRIAVTAARALEAGTAISTDDVLAYPDIRHLPRLIPHFLRLAIPMMDATVRLGRAMDAHMSAIENEDIVLTKEAGIDTVYGGALFDLMSLLAAQELDVPHPRDTLPGAAEALSRSMTDADERVVSGDPMKPNFVRMLQPTVFTRAEERRKIDQLRRKAEQLAIDAEVNMIRMMQISEAFNSQS